MRTTFIAVASLVFSFSRLLAAIPGDDGIRGRQALAIELRNLLDDENFAELDRRAESYAIEKQVFADGWWKLTQFFFGLGEPIDLKNERAWEKHLAHIEHWVANSAANHTALTAQGVAFTRYAWAARGGGYADTITESGGRLFVERLDRARVILNLVPERMKPGQKLGAGWYAAMLTVALGQGWDRIEYDVLFREAVAAHPDYYEFYLKKGTYLLPRWMGAEGEWQQFARGAGASAGADVFARICWANGGLEGYTNLFTTCGITWEEVDRGFTELRKKCPRSAWTLNFYCRLACGAKQKEKAAALFREIGEDYYAEAWSTRAFYDQARAWALGVRR